MYTGSFSDLKDHFKEFFECYRFLKCLLHNVGGKSGRGQYHQEYEQYGSDEFSHLMILISERAVDINGRFSHMLYNQEITNSNTPAPAKQ